MIDSTLMEQKAAALFLFSSIETRLFRVEIALPIPREVIKQISLNNIIKQTGSSVSVRHWQASTNSEQSGFDGRK